MCIYRDGTLMYRAATYFRLSNRLPFARAICVYVYVCGHWNSYAFVRDKLMRAARYFALFRGMYVCRTRWLEG